MIDIRNEFFNDGYNLWTFVILVDKKIVVARLRARMMDEEMRDRNRLDRVANATNDDWWASECTESDCICG